MIDREDRWMEERHEECQLGGSPEAEESMTRLMQGRRPYSRDGGGVSGTVPLGHGCLSMHKSRLQTSNDIDVAQEGRSIQCYEM